MSCGWPRYLNQESYKRILGKCQEIQRNTGKYQDKIKNKDGRRKFTGTICLAVGLARYPNQESYKGNTGKVPGNTKKYWEIPI